MQKERITMTLDADLVERIDRLAELSEHSRSKMAEILLERGADEYEEFMQEVGSPVLGPIVQAIVDHPKLVETIAKLVGEGLTAKELDNLKKNGPKIRAVRERMRNERGRRNDLRPEGA